MLQMEFDREYDAQLRREEKKINGDSKGTFIKRNIFPVELFLARSLNWQSCEEVANP